MKKWIVAIWLLLLTLIVSVFFWYNQLVYLLPTPVPKNYKDVSRNTVISLDPGLNFKNNLPVFLHFFNPDCPCSKFNISYFNSLVKTYQNKVNFVIVLMTEKPYTPIEIQQRFNIHIPVIADMSLAAVCGIYSTPQAVILKADHRLYYKGNYNRTRYCTDEKTGYAKIALDGLLNNTDVHFSPLTLKAYGCTLPNCKN
ncbi:TlpA family protein disulfide reductase [Pedobacter sp. AW31-3R]|uniref:TlpA family protein disulfide reductase n=1 Tax=Pedobacter sp. AW31-3R TaxID=3445781 RepID=UPI003F9F390C